MADAEVHNAFIYFSGGKIIGESADAEFKKYDASEITSFEIKGENLSDRGGKADGGKVKFEDFTIKKKSDSATAMMFKEMCNSTKFDQVVVTLRRDMKPFMVYTFKMVKIASISTTQEGDQEAMDDVKLDYGAVKIVYLKQDKSGETTKVCETNWSRIKNEGSDRTS